MVSRSRAAVRGSSPPVRGTVAAVHRAGPAVRFIPARAGNRVDAHFWSAADAVHPRPCGEQDSQLVTRCGQGGSSPPVRGTGDDAADWLHLLRFIPARAGNRALCAYRMDASQVHPRPCGEQDDQFRQWDVAIGSSPPVRGTVRKEIDALAPGRFIPARAGNSRPGWYRPGGRTVHPRPCGEQGFDTPAPEWEAGSSPPVRGTDFFYFIKIIELIEQQKIHQL